MFKLWIRNCNSTCKRLASILILMIEVPWRCNENLVGFDCLKQDKSHNYLFQICCASKLGTIQNLGSKRRTISFILL